MKARVALFVAAAVALAAPACSSAKKATGGALGSLDAARTCARFINVLADKNNDKLTPAQVRVKFFTTAAELEADAAKDAKLAPLADVAKKMSDAIKAGDTNTAYAFAKDTVRQCTPLLKAHHLLTP